MIPNITRGVRVTGLLHYLWGPGKREEHTDPHLVAAWDGAGELGDLEPVAAAGRRHNVRRLAELLEIPVRAGRNPPRKPVWHCSVRAHPTDPIMSDERWGEIAAHVMARTGLAPHGDGRAVRWIAMRHGPDHIHIVATLVRQDRRTAWARNDWPLSQAACRELEDRYDLYRVARPGQGTRAWPTNAETNKAVRAGRPVTAREELRRRVRDAASVAVDERDFFRRLTHDGHVTLNLRHSTIHPGAVTGYSVALAGNTAAGEPVFYGGAKLAADLSLTRLRARWQSDTTLAGSDRRAQRLQPAPAEIYQRAATLITDTAATLGANAANPGAVAGTLAAAADLLTATAAAWEGTTGGPLTQAAELFDRAAHEATRTPRTARRGGHGYPLRVLARLVTSTRARRPGDAEMKAMLRIVRAMAGFADAVHDIRAAQQRVHQAHAARGAATILRAYTPTPPARYQDNSPDPMAVAAPGLTAVQQRPTTKAAARGHR